MAINLETMVNQLARELVLQADKLEAQRKFFWHELTTLRDNIPGSEWENGQLLWLALNHFVALPKTFHDQEVNHGFGTVKALAAGITKSNLYQQPIVEIHCTACPSYLDSDDWETIGKETGIYVYQSIKPNKLAVLQSFAESLLSFRQYISGVYLHTPSPQDLEDCGDFSGCFGIFNKGESGQKSLFTHWQQMESIVNQLPGITLCPDVAYMIPLINSISVEQLMQQPEVVAAWQKFKSSEYIDSAYAKWGAKVADVFAAFYLGSILAYGNHESALTIDNNQPVKLYLNLEEGQSPYTFAGQSVGTDFRHLLADQGYHLPLLIGQSSIVTPWAGK